MILIADLIVQVAKSLAASKISEFFEVLSFIVTRLAKAGASGLHRNKIHVRSAELTFLSSFSEKRMKTAREQSGKLVM